MMGLLTHKDLLKPNLTLPELRHVTFHRMLSTCGIFETTHGSTTLEVDQDILDRLLIGDVKCLMTSSGKYAKCFRMANTDVFIRLCDIYKTESVIGRRRRLTNQTQLQECGQAYLLAEHLSHDPWAMCDMVCNPKEVMEFVVTPTWEKSFIHSTTAIMGHLAMLAITSHTHSIHRKSLTVQHLYDIAASFGDYKFSSSDRWNPSDIWIISNNLVIPQPQTFHSIREFNTWMKQQFFEGNLIGISLKKVNQTVRIQTVNEHYKSRNVSDIQYLFTRTADIFSSKECTIKCKSNDEQYTMRIRQTTLFGNVMVEIAGKLACLGKLGFGTINNILIEYGLSPIDCQTDLVVAERECKRIAKANGYCDVSTSTDFYSKYQSMRLIEILQHAEQKTATAVITTMLDMASSTSQHSSIHLKVF